MKAVYGTRSDRHCAMSIGKGRGLLMFRLVLGLPASSLVGWACQSPSPIRSHTRIAAGQRDAPLYLSPLHVEFNFYSVSALPALPSMATLYSPFPLSPSFSGYASARPSTPRSSSRSISLLPLRHQSAVDALSLVFRSWKDAKRMSEQRCRRARGLAVLPYRLC